MRGDFRASANGILPERILVVPLLRKVRPWMAVLVFPEHEIQRALLHVNGAAITDDRRFCGKSGHGWPF
jgi:hypothetical protein